ncbi:ATP-binding cassette domain-containing protein [Amycolatopsis sp. 195334CR]|uniref:ATP-binding cassette domain-containing protein n=1 Tax=Amycolatopsis sp. 195334CR TaxID=2814588 RepID=UPI001A8DB4B8|nr:ATP-binding cassette domain-containing protein [Amycolatopsis sp. 195334CR]MBN6037057.1 ATP-binding cassette domain-containing protein [Amycolatopsis sp. 195334CR]
MSSDEFAVQADGLRKHYGDKRALDGFDLRVPRGSVCGLLGPNGAGKTTSVRILATLVRLDGGQARVGGFDVATEPHRVRRTIGLVGQHAAVDEVLSGHQNLVMFARLHHLDRRAAQRRAAELLTRFGLADTGTKPVKSYSGGMRRRLDLAASMILAPAVLFLDEPTVGLDPRGRNEVWEAVRELVADGTTVLLTTQYLDEADQLADRIAVIDHGRVIAEGSPGELKSRIGGDRIDVIPHHAADLAKAAEALKTLLGGEPDVDPDTRRISVRVTGHAAALPGVVRALDDAGVRLDDLALRLPTLDEVFLQLTGRTEATV